MKFKKLALAFPLLAGAVLPFAADASDANREARIEKIEAELAELKKVQSEATSGLLGDATSGAFPSWFSLGGEWELEYVDAENEQTGITGGTSSANWRTDKFVLKPKIKLSKNLVMQGEIEMNRGGAQLEEYHATFSGLPLDSWIRIGFDERFSKADKKFDMADRKTENYPLIGTAFWRDEMYAIQWGGKKEVGGAVKDVFWRLHFGDGLELNDRDIGEDNDPSNAEITHDNDQDPFPSSDRNKELGFGLGLTFEPSKNYTFDVAAWLVDSNLTQNDINQLTNISTYRNRGAGGLTDDTQERMGFRTTHKLKSEAGETTFVFEYADAEDGLLERDGHYYQLSHKFKFNPLIGGEFLSWAEPLVRIEDYNTNLTRSATGGGYGETWDRKQQVYALLLGLVSNKKLKSTLKLEYIINEEDTGHIAGSTTTTDDPDNDAFLAQFEFKF